MGRGQLTILTSADRTAIWKLKKDHGLSPSAIARRFKLSIARVRTIVANEEAIYIDKKKAILKHKDEFQDTYHISENQKTIPQHYNKNGMITCDTCGKLNPIESRYCKCGETIITIKTIAA